MRRRTDDAVRITTATRSHSEDLSGRQRRYLFSMSIRTVCFILAIVFREYWFTWFFVAGAVFLPYIAVVIANAGSSPDPGGMEVYTPEHPELEGRPGAQPLGG